MRFLLPTGRRSAAALIGALLVAAVAGGVVFFVWSIDRERERALAADRVVVEMDELSPPNTDGVTLWMADAPPRDVEPFGGQVYVATESGLSVYDEHGQLAKKLTTLDGLPENSITCLERFDGKLWIGTEHRGLVSYDGDRLKHYRFVKPAASRVTALLAEEGRLLVGTFDAGLFEYTGSEFSRDVLRGLPGEPRRVTALMARESRVYVGTFDAGLVEWKEGGTHEFVETDGLPSNRVTSLAVGESSVLVGTDRGVARLTDDGKLATVNGTPNVTGLAVHAGEIWVSSLTSGVARIDRPGIGVETRPASLTVDVRGDREALGLKVEDGIVWSFRASGLYASLGTDSGGVRFERFDTGAARTSPLSDGHVSALAVDASGRLWAGLFDGGVNVLDVGTGDVIEHMTDPMLNEINATVAIPGTDRVWVASSAGAVLFDRGRKVRTLSEKDSLVSPNVAGIAQGDGDRVALATSKGVSIADGPVTRSFTAFNGLPSNHTYSIAIGGQSTFVGTLGGFAEIKDQRVTRAFTTANSRLTHNWVNSLVWLEGRLYIGTYGGGVVVLMPGGEILPEEATAGLEVNPGAMAVVGRRLIVGTLDDGAWLLDLDTQRWTKIETVLSSPNVTAIASTDNFLFLGTENGVTRIERRKLGLEPTS